MFALSATGPAEVPPRLRAARARREARPVRRPRRRSRRRSGPRRRPSSWSRSRARRACCPRRPATSRRRGSSPARAGALLCLDEVQTGMGRTGRMWAHEWEGVDARPHVVRQGARERLPDGRDARDRGGRGAPHARQPREHLRRERARRRRRARGARGDPRGCCPRRARVSARLVERLERARAPGGRVAGVRGRGMLVGVRRRAAWTPARWCGSARDARAARERHRRATWSGSPRRSRSTAAEADLAVERLAAAIAAAPAKA